MPSTPAERLHDRRHFNLRTIHALRQAAKTSPANSDILELIAYRIDLCNHPDNHWFATYNSTTNPITVHGQHWRCHSKMCSHCNAYHGRRNRRRLTAAILQQEPKPNETYRFVTLTIVNPGLPTMQTRELVNRAWVLFRKTDFWRSLLVGGCKSEEFTLTSTGIHYHLHLLILSPWFNYKELRTQWTLAYQKACQELLEVTPAINTTDGLLLCVVRFVPDLNRCLFEMTKYLTKGESFENMPPEELDDIATVPRFNRMFEMLGTFREVGTIVHNRPVSDGYESLTQEHEATQWRDMVKIHGLEIEKCSITLKWTGQSSTAAAVWTTIVTLQP